MTDLVQHLSEIAQRLYGEPNKRLSTKTKLCFGTHGSLAVDLTKGQWFDHEAGEGGNIVQLIERGAGLTNGGVEGWIAENFNWSEQRGRTREKEGTRALPASKRPGESDRKVAEAFYDYVDQLGELVFQVVRFQFVDAEGNPDVGGDGKVKKTFRQRRKARADDAPKSIDDGWVWSVKGLDLVPYHLPELLEAIGNEQPIYIAEGEKKVDLLQSLGVAATCAPMGAGKWPECFTETFAGANVYLLPDNDEAGQKHADTVAAALKPVAASVRVVDLPDLPKKGDVVDWVDAGGTVDALHALTATSRPWGAALHYGAVWFADTETRLESPEWLVDDMLTRGDLSLCFGPSKSGKSFFATDVALSVARGAAAHGRKVHQGGVIYIASEGRKGFKNRLTAYRKHFEISANTQLPFLLIPTAVDLYAEDGDTKGLIEEFEQAAAMMSDMASRLELIVIDTLSSVSPGANENASEDMSRIIRHCQQMQQRTHAHVMIIHHKNAAGDRPRGHTSLYAGCDNAIEVSCDIAKNRTAAIDKLKDGEDGTSLGFRLQTVTIGTRVDGKQITSCVVVPHESGPRTSDKGLALTPQANVALKALRKAIAEFGEPAPGVLQLPYGMRVVAYRHWAIVFTKMSFDSDDEKPEIVKKAIQRAGTQLLSRGIIAKNSPYVWIVRDPLA